MPEIEEVVHNLERFYQFLTGRDAPDPSTTYAPIPPEANAEQWVSDQVDRLIATLNNPPAGIIAAAIPWAPPLTVLEGDDHLLLRVDLPGVPREDVKISVNQNVVTIEGVRTSATSNHGEHKVRTIEAWTGRFRRQILVPPGARTEELGAQMKDGILEIRLPRTVPPAESRTIPVA